jgi:uncharacterized membrane protein
LDDAMENQPSPNTTPPQPSSPQPPSSQDQAKTLATVVYALQAASLILGLTSLVGVILNYIKRGEVAGTIAESHFTWQIRTFWITFILGIIGVLLSAVIIGLPLLFLLGVWFIYRFVRGWLWLNANEPVPNPKAWF